MSDENLLAILGCLGAKVISYSKKDTIIAEGSAPKYIGIMLSGTAQIIHIDYFGNRSIVSNLAESELFGESFACAGVKSMPVGIIAKEKCTVMLIECARMTGSCANSCEFHRQLIKNLVQVVAHKNLVFHRKIDITSKRTTRDKLMAYLLYKAEKHNSNRFSIPFNRQELADYLEVDRSGLSAEISKLRREGIIENHKNEFTLLKTN